MLLWDVSWIRDSSYDLLVQEAKGRLHVLGHAWLGKDIDHCGERGCQNELIDINLFARVHRLLELLHALLQVCDQGCQGVACLLEWVAYHIKGGLLHDGLW